MTTEVEPLDGTAPAVTTKLRQKVFVQLCAERGLKTATAIAAALGLSDRTIKRTVNLDDKPDFVPDDPSGRFIGRTLAVWPMCSFGALFAVIDETTGKEVR